jgi:hypothetical protein
MPTSRQTTASGVAEASISEEPGAVIPLAGIRAGRGWVTAPSTATCGLASRLPELINDDERQVGFQEVQS